MSAYSLRGTEEYFVDDDKHILSRMRAIYDQVSPITQARWVQQSIDERFYAGDQSLWQEIYSQIPAHRRKQFSFNKIKRIVNMISGYQRQNRKSLVATPIENSDQKTCDQFSKLLIWANNQANVLNILSDAFLGSLVTGMNLLSVWMDYREDPFSGDIRVDNMSYNGYIIDPYFKKHDLSDCNYIWTRKFLSKKQIASLMPDREDEISKMRADTSRDGYFNFLPENYNLSQRDLLPYDEFWYLDYRDATILVDPETEEVLEWKGDDENLKLFLRRFPTLRKQKIQKQTCKLAIAVNNRIFYNGKNPFKIDKYPFVPVLAYYQPELPYYEWRIQGVVRNLRDSQFILNRRQQILLDILESQINSGLKVMEDSLIDDRDAFKSGQGQALFIKKDAPLGMESVQKIPPGDVSPSMIQVIDQMDKNMMQISGVNEELLGSAEDDKAGILSMLRQGAGLTTLQNLFDQLDESMKNLGRLEMDLIQNNFTPAKVKRIIEQEPTNQFYNHSFQKYDCEIVEGSNTPTQRMMSFKQALHLRELGLPVPTEFLIEMSSFQNKAEMVEQIKAQEQQQAQQQQQMQALQMAELQAKSDLAQSRAMADRGLAAERVSRVNENESLSVERRAQAALDEIKAVKELQGLNLDQIEQMMGILNTVKESQDIKTEQLDPVKTQQPKMSPQNLQQNI